MIKSAIKNVKWTIGFEVYALKKHIIGKRKAKKYKNHTNLKLHLACGERPKKGWLNIDLFSAKADLLLDLRRPFPFANQSCDEIYSEHFVEHLQYPDGVLAFLSEAKRVLKPGGKLTTCVPDTVWPMKSYFEGDNADYFRLANERNWHPGLSDTRMEHLNFHYRQNGEHLFAYDEETLIHILKKAGFNDNISREFDPEMDAEFRHPGTICIVSKIKP